MTADPLSHLLVRAILWQKDVRVYLDYEPPRFRRNTFLADTAEAIDTLRQMAVTVCPYFAVAPQEPGGHGPRYGGGCSGRREDGEQNDPLPQRRDHHTRRTRCTGRDRCDPAV